MKLTTQLDRIKGVGPKTAAALAAAGLETVADALAFLPRRYDDVSEVVSIADLRPGMVTLRARCESVSTRTVRRGMSVTTAVLVDDTSKVRAVWFNQPYRVGQLKTDREFVVSGEFGLKRNQYQLTNPSVELASDMSREAGESIVPIYRQIKGIKPKTIRDLLSNLRPIIEFLPETLPSDIISRQDLVSRSEAIRMLHAPTTRQEIDQGRQRLAFEELFEMLLAAQLNKQENSKLQGWPIPFEQSVIKQFVDSLPFSLTDAQRRASWQIIQDIESATPMNRLLQGDVGSGKTVVAGLAARQVVSAGFQVAMMAPTELLATQHAQTLSKLLESSGVKLALLTSSVKGAARKLLYEQLTAGEIDIVIGTHALIQPTVVYQKLGLVIIDEQHRFGVEQRHTLLKKSTQMPHLLSMTATPIPRSLALTLYGELDISILDELPANRKPIETKIWSPASAPSMYQAIDAEIARGRQAYIICSLIDDNPDNDKKSVESEYARLKKTIFSSRKLGLLHGKLSSDDKKAVMEQFSRGEIDILVSTTVVEVGVDVPNASVMLIENADNFGLSQLHQLRGRVGRGEHQSYCHLMVSGHDKPSQRLREIERSQDGFHLAEVDLELRGAGEIYGRAQHGALNLQIATLSDTKLIARAQTEARRFVEEGVDLLQYKELAQAVLRYQRVTTLN